MKRVYITLFTILMWTGGFGQNALVTETPLTIAKQGSFAVGGTVLQRSGEYDNSKFIGFGTPVEQGQSYHADHAVVDFQIPVNARQLPLIFVHGYGPLLADDTRRTRRISDIDVATWFQLLCSRYAWSWQCRTHNSRNCTGTQSRRTVLV